ncbi:MAG TPA: ArsA family ATPase [Thermoanaerobaculia bacterium]
MREAFPGYAIRFLPEDLTPLTPLSHRPPPDRERGENAQHAAPVQTPGGRGRPSPGWWGGDGRGVGGEVPRLLFFGGKGGVGKTTCAAATALLLAERWPDRRILLLSTDPAHSLADALEAPLGDDERPVPGAPPGLRARELDAPETFEEWRSRHLGEVEEWLDSAGDLDREALRDLVALAPPGLDELAAVSALIDALFGKTPAYDLVIVDTAPTGHALRLLETPGVMLEWVRTLLSLLLKYREAVRLGRFAEELLELSRGLKRLGETMRDPERTRFLAVTRAAELPRRETLRLLKALDRLGIAAPAVIVDAVLPAGCPRCEREAMAQEKEIALLRQGLERCAIILAPAVFPPPRGVEALKEWGRSWG